MRVIRDLKKPHGCGQERPWRSIVYGKKNSKGKRKHRQDTYFHCEHDE